MPGNLHYHRDTPNPESEGLRDGTLEVLPSLSCSASHLYKPPDCLPADGFLHLLAGSTWGAWCLHHTVAVQFCLREASCSQACTV